MIRESQMKAYLNQQREMKRQEAVIAKLKSFNREKSIKRAESREKMLEKITPLDKPFEKDAQMHIHLEPNISSGNDVLYAENPVSYTHLDVYKRQGYYSIALEALWARPVRRLFL